MRAQVGDRIHHIEHAFGYIDEVIAFLDNAYYATFYNGPDRIHTIVFEEDFHNCTATGKY
jgi:hypothetical protein